MSRLTITPLLQKIHEELLPGVQIQSLSLYDPVVVTALPEPWQLLGAGNYAAVLYHPDYPDRVVKIYQDLRKGTKYKGWPCSVSWAG